MGSARRRARGGAALLGVVLGTAAPGPAQERPRPTLVVLVVVDQMRADYLQRFRPHFHGGLARMLDQGAVFEQAFQDHGVTETAPGHATMLSGRHPASTSIIINERGVPDSAAPLLEAPDLGASPRRFRGTALYDWMAARYPLSRALSVSRKDRSAILPVGRSRAGGQVYWFRNARFTTSRYYADTLPGWVRAFNARAEPARRPGLAWELLLPPDAYPEPDSVPFEHRGRDVVFPHRLPDDSGRAAARVIEMPWMDSLILAFALEGVDQLRLGAEDRPDLLVVSLSTTDHVGHAFGPDSREVHDQVVRVDRYLGPFLDSLFARRDPRRVLVALTSDHGITPMPEVARAQRNDTAAGYVGIDSVIRAARVSLEAQAGPGRWLPYRDHGMILLDRQGLAARGVDVDSVAEDLAERFRALPGVAQVDTRRTLARADTTRDVAARRWIHHLGPGDSAEVMVTPLPGRYFARTGEAAHGQPSDDDAHVPLIIMGTGVRPGRYPARAAVVDLAPTLARLLGVAPLERVDGRVLIEALEPAHPR
jgi:hypothetical protein